MIALIINLAPNPYIALEIAFWLLGSLRDRSFDHVVLAGPFMIASWIVLLLQAPAYRALTLGEDAALSLGVDVERTRLWTARHKAYFAGMQMNPGCRSVTTDTCVPISRLAEIIEASVADADASGLPYYIVGHVGDGNFHLAYLVKEGDAGQRATAERLSMQMVQRAIALEGTCTGEHGIGLHKMGFLEGETGAGAIAAMRAIKRALDPGNIMNPGKIFAL